MRFCDAISPLSHDPHSPIIMIHKHARLYVIQRLSFRSEQPCASIQSKAGFMYSIPAALARMSTARQDSDVLHDIPSSGQGHPGWRAMWAEGAARARQRSVACCDSQRGHRRASFSLLSVDRTNKYAISVEQSY